jgi:hypothetical protein
VDIISQNKIFVNVMYSTQILKKQVFYR